jgi:hypothetical protein
VFKRRAEITQEQKQQLMGVWDILYHVCVWLFYDSRAESLYDAYAVIFDIPVMTLSGHVTNWTLAIIMMVVKT